MHNAETIAIAPVVWGTPRQEKAARMYAENLVGSEHRTGKELLAAAGYQPDTQKKPAQVFSGDRFQQILQKYLPLERVTQRHAEILENAEDATALRAAELAYKVSGKLQNNVNVQHFAGFLSSVTSDVIDTEAQDVSID